MIIHDYGTDTDSAMIAGAEIVNSGGDLVQVMHGGGYIFASINGKIIELETIEQAARMANAKNVLVTEYNGECE